MKMEGNGLTTRMYTNTSNIGRGMLPLQAQNPQKLTEFMGLPQKEAPKYPIDQQQTQLSIKQPNFNNPSPKPPQKPKIQLTQSSKNEEDDSHEKGSNDLKREKNGSSVSQWQRVKWSDDMVRLLILAVYYIGDEAGGSELVPDKKKPGCGSVGVLQKKGKWKSVSMAMMEKGFCVSPQQCEDKFNDLNKRYKRVNDILGKGIACKVVENQGLLQNMDIAPNLKEEVRKLLNSKHLFFREMCAYHNTCGGGSGCETATNPPPQHNWDGGDSNNEDDSEDEDDDDDEVEDHEDGNDRKRARTLGTASGNGLNQWSGIVKGMVEDGSKSLREKKQWVMIQRVKLEENGVKIQYQALELDKERLKWMKFSSKKEREMEKMKIDNEKKRLENERKVLMLRKKEIECLLAEKQQ